MRRTHPHYRQTTLLDFKLHGIAKKSYQRRDLNIHSNSPYTIRWLLVAKRRICLLRKSQIKGSRGEGERERRKLQGAKDREGEERGAKSEGGVDIRYIPAWAPLQSLHSMCLEAVIGN